MKVRLVKEVTIQNYVKQNPASKSGFEHWLPLIRQADWEKPADIKATFPTADLLGNGSSRVVFDIGGNKYQLIAKYLFGEQKVHLFICFIGTHQDYDGVNKRNEQYTINQY